jgi:hypothetical protein
MVAQTHSYAQAATNAWVVPAQVYGTVGATAFELFLGLGLINDLDSQLPSIVAGSQTVAGTNAMAAAARGNTQLYHMKLVGMNPTGTQNDAVGAFMGIGPQRLVNTIQTLPNAANSQVRNSARMWGIEWLEGEDPNILPGSYSIPPITPNAADIFQDAVSRGTGLIAN